MEYEMVAKLDRFWAAVKAAWWGRLWVVMKVVMMEMLPAAKWVIERVA